MTAFRDVPPDALTATVYASIADEIVGALRPTEVWPALCAPVIDDAGFARGRLETLGLAQGRRRRMPQIHHREHPDAASKTILDGLKGTAGHRRAAWIIGEVVCADQKSGLSAVGT